MEGSHSPKMDSEVSEFKPDTQASKRRKVVEKTVVKVRIAANAGNLKNEGPPSDSWSWRKYGQKPIKGSPYPRGYYRCSSSKGCSAKKQVERCRTDASMLIITYTSSHNHPGPDLPNPNLNRQPKKHHLTQPHLHPTEDHPTNTPPEQEHLQEEEPKQDQPIKLLTDDHKPAGEEQNNTNFHYLQSPLRSSQDIMVNQEDPLTETPEMAHETSSILLDVEPVPCTELTTISSTPKSEENDFFDELEELPISSAFTSFMRGNLFDERIPAVRS